MTFGPTRSWCIMGIVPSGAVVILHLWRVNRPLASGRGHCFQCLVAFRSRLISWEPRLLAFPGSHQFP